MISIIAGAVVMFIVGAIWFTVLFGKLWSRLMNRTEADIAKAKALGMTRQMVIMFVLNLVSAYTLHYLIYMMGLSLTDSLFIVLIIWIAFTLPSVMNAYLWESKSMKLVLINAGGSLAAFLAGSAAIYYIR